MNTFHIASIYPLSTNLFCFFYDGKKAFGHLGRLCKLFDKVLIEVLALEMCLQIGLDSSCK